VASVLAVQNGAVLEMTGDAAKIEFGGALTLIHNNTEDQLTCSGKIQASDVLIEGTSTTVADLIGEVATLRQEMAAVKAFVGMMPPPVVSSPVSPPPPAVPPSLPPPPPPHPSPPPCENGWSKCADEDQHGSSSPGDTGYCSFTGNKLVRYVSVDDHTRYNEQTITNGALCANINVGGVFTDPHPGHLKKCIITC